MGKAALRRPAELYLCQTRREIKVVYKLYDFSRHARNKSEAAGGDSRSLQNAKLAVPPTTRATSTSPRRPPSHAWGCTQPWGGSSFAAGRGGTHQGRAVTRVSLPGLPGCPHRPCRRGHPAPQLRDGRMSAGVK